MAGGAPRAATIRIGEKGVLTTGKKLQTVAAAPLYNQVV